MLDSGGHRPIGGVSHRDGGGASDGVSFPYSHAAFAGDSNTKTAIPGGSLGIRGPDLPGGCAEREAETTASLHHHRVRIKLPVGSLYVNVLPLISMIASFA
jgi:hypothetical protein